MSSEPGNREQEILETLLGFLERFPTKSGTLTAQTDLSADLSLDSVSMMEILVEVEDAYDISLPLNMMANVSTVQDLVDQIKPLVESTS
ncbi:acyl carrier protein [Roseovarius sp. D22-M7]|uniref:acyl carrier protein n=1 Tax=Roseovarius sp. D22-M7 TaxID=3127116 RepID=UPI003010011D